MVYNESYLKLYIPSHTNAGCFLIGMICGYAYRKMKQNDIDIKKISVKSFEIKF